MGVRVLFGLPVGSAGDGDDLQRRINAIQDAFESSSGLGEAAPIFEELIGAAGGSGAQNVAWDGFLSYCQQERVRECVSKAVSLLPREHAVGVAFEATHEWKVVPEGAACGLVWNLKWISPLEEHWGGSRVRNEVAGDAGLIGKHVLSSMHG